MVRAQIVQDERTIDRLRAASSASETSMSQIVRQALDLYFENREPDTSWSIPEPIFEAAERVAKRFELSRSELYSKAVAAFVREQGREDITERLNRVYADQDSTMDPAIEGTITRSIAPGYLVMKRGEIWWADLGIPVGSEPGLTRPVLIVQANEFNQSAVQTVLAVPMTSNLRLADAPGNVKLKARETGLPRTCVANV